MRTFRVKSLAALSVAALVGVAALSGSNAAQAANPKSITVWLMPDAKDFGTALADATASFNRTYPNVKVNVEFQTWADHLKKLDAALVAKKGPDVVEFGNTEVMKYSAAGALTDLTGYKSRFGNSSKWLNALTEAGTYEGKLYAVPYYAGARAIMYRRVERRTRNNDVGVLRCRESRTCSHGGQEWLRARHYSCHCSRWTACGRRSWLCAFCKEHVHHERRVLYRCQ